MAAHLIHTGPKVVPKKLPLKLGHNVKAHIILKELRRKHPSVKKVIRRKRVK